ncbi:MAG: cytidine(C)-cytidine(C)-adenosine (A)]-adding enzyme [Gemmatales bacterium]|nr:MAG: cytidine(C)-cytidine(C)-adenosine (A)]-adding enzyme [Gemmatales bacterium]
MTEREFAVRVVKRLREAGHEALWAGGCVRDELLGLSPKDYDVATDARPERVQQLFRRTIAVGASFGVIEVLGPKSEKGPLKVQVATFRSDVSYSDGRHPDAVVFATAREDALRRDFTINGMFFDPLENKLIDYVGGQQDLKDRILRAIGNPKHRFQEDKLRMLRGVRLATRFGLSIEPATRQAISDMASEISVVSAERICEELKQLLIDPNRAQGVRLLYETGLLWAIFPELSGPFDIDRCCATLAALGEQVTFALALAALLIDIDPRLVDEVCRRLRLSNNDRRLCVWFVSHAKSLRNARQFAYCELKPILAHEGCDELLALAQASASAEGDRTDAIDFCRDLLKRWSPSALDPEPLLTGDDLRKMGVAPGPHYKRILQTIRDAQLNEEIGSREEAVRFAEKLLAGERKNSTSGKRDNST